MVSYATLQDYKVLISLWDRVIDHQIAEKGLIAFVLFLHRF